MPIFLYHKSFNVDFSFFGLSVYGEMGGVKIWVWDRE